MAINQSGSYANPRLDLGIPLFEFQQQNDEFIGLKASPLMPVSRKAATYPAITRESLTRGGADLKRSVRSAYNRDDIQTKDKTYACQEYGHEQGVDDSEREFYTNDFDAASVASMVAYRRVAQAQELRIANALFNTTTWTGAALYVDNSGSPWATAATNVKTQVMTAKEKVRTNTGMDANTLVISKATWVQLMQNNALNSAIQYVQAATVQALNAALAAYLGMDQILIGKAVQNTATEGQSFVKGDIWSNLYAMVAYVPKSNDLREPAVMRTFNWIEDNSADGLYVEEYREEATRSNIYRVRQNVAEVVIDPYFGFLMKIN